MIWIVLIPMILGDFGRTDIFIILSFHLQKHNLNLILSDYPSTISHYWCYLCTPLSFLLIFQWLLFRPHWHFSNIYRDNISNTLGTLSSSSPISYFPLYTSSCSHSHIIHLDISNSYNNCNSFNFLLVILLPNDNLFAAYSLSYTNHWLHKNLQQE